MFHPSSIKLSDCHGLEVSYNKSLTPRYPSTNKFRYGDNEGHISLVPTRATMFSRDIGCMRRRLLKGLVKISEVFLSSHSHWMENIFNVEFTCDLMNIRAKIKEISTYDYIILSHKQRCAVCILFLTDLAYIGNSSADSLITRSLGLFY